MTLEAPAAGASSLPYVFGCFGDRFFLTTNRHICPKSNDITVQKVYSNYGHHHYFQQGCPDGEPYSIGPFLLCPLPYP